MKFRIISVVLCRGKGKFKGKVKGKGRVKVKVTLKQSQSRTGPEVSRRLRFPELKKTGTRRL
jgi:hypothetical protein